MYSSRDKDSLPLGKVYKCQARGRQGESLHKETERVAKRTHCTGCAAGGFPSGLGWEVRLGYTSVSYSWVGLALSSEFVN